MFFKKPNDSQNAVALIKLKNGSEVPLAIIITTMDILNRLQATQAVAFHHLVKKCRDSAHNIADDTIKILEKNALMKDGLVHITVKDILLSAIQGDDQKITLNSPVEYNIKISSRM